MVVVGVIVGFLWFHTEFHDFIAIGTRPSRFGPLPLGLKALSAEGRAGC